MMAIAANCNHIATTLRELHCGNYTRELHCGPTKQYCMTRHICIEPFPQQRATKLSKQGIYKVITPSRLAARAVSAQYQSLQSLALEFLQQQGQIQASSLQAQQQFRQTLQAVLQPADLLGTARSWMPVVRSLLQSCPHLEHDSKNSSTHLSARSASLIEVARQYQSALRSDRLIDSSELYWRAAELEPVQQSLLVYGYFQPRPDELAWINKIAAPDSLFFLPASEQPLFADTQAAISWLQQQGWKTMPASDTLFSSQVLSQTCSPNAQLCCSFLVAAPLQELPEKLIAEPIETASAYAYGTFEAEIRGTLAQVKALLNEDIPAKEIAIIARDERAYGPKLIDIAWEYGGKVHFRVTL